MGAKSFLLTGDVVSFNTIEGGTLMAPAQTIMQGSSKSTDSKREFCVEGDEKNAFLASCAYMTPVYSIPGLVMCKIKKLNESHISSIAAYNNKKILYIGSNFDVEYKVLQPAQQPTPTGPIPDSKPSYNGKGCFIETGKHTIHES